jgi:hypothetical protein
VLALQRLSHARTARSMRSGSTGFER